MAAEADHSFATKSIFAHLTSSLVSENSEECYFGTAYESGFSAFRAFRYRSG